MRYYKVTSGQNFVGIGTSDDLKCFLQSNRVLITCNEKLAEFIQINGICYHASWMRKSKATDIQAELVNVIEIGQEEYEDINSTIQDSNGELTDEEINDIINDEPVEPEPYVDPNEVLTVDYVKNNKLLEIRKMCNVMITRGLDIELSDGLTHHFSLTEQDQSNLIALSLSVARGETAIPYHADDELCVFYSPADITTIVNKATEYITYHTTYHNSLKAYVNSLRSVNTISKVEYGMDIPEKYQSDVLKAIYATQAQAE